MTRCDRIGLVATLVFLALAASLGLNAATVSLESLQALSPWVAAAIVAFPFGLAATELAFAVDRSTAEPSVRLSLAMLALVFAGGVLYILAPSFDDQAAWVLVLSFIEFAAVTAGVAVGVWVLGSWLDRTRYGTSQPGSRGSQAGTGRPGGGATTPGQGGAKRGVQNAKRALARASRSLERAVRAWPVDDTSRSAPSGQLDQLERLAEEARDVQDRVAAFRRRL